MLDVGCCREGGLLMWQDGANSSVRRTGDRAPGRQRTDLQVRKLRIQDVLARAFIIYVLIYEVRTESREFSWKTLGLGSEPNIRR